MGKTSLLNAARARLAASGLVTLRARGTELEQPYALGVVQQLLDRVLRDAGPDVWEGSAAHARPVFERAGAGGPLPATDLAFSLRQGLYWALAEVAERLGPLALLVDDVQ